MTTGTVFLTFGAVVAIYAILSAAVHRFRRHLERQRIRREMDDELAAYDAAQQRSRNG